VADLTGVPRSSIQAGGRRNRPETSSANDLGKMGRDVDPPGRHYRARRLPVAIGLPNTSSNERPRRPLAKYRRLARIWRMRTGSLSTSTVSFGIAYGCVDVSKNVQGSTVSRESEDHAANSKIRNRQK